MSRNGSGVYSLPAGNPVVTNTTISTTWANTTLTDLATAMTGSVAADGQTPLTGALNMNNNKISSLADGTLSADATTLNQVNTAIAAAGATYLLKASNLSDVANATTSRTNLVAAKSGANSDITSLTGLTTPLTVAQGGTGAATLTSNNVLLGNGTSAPQVVAPSTSGNVLTSNGTTWQSTAPTAGLGNANQTYTDVTASRVNGTTYTNSTGAPIFVIIFGDDQTGQPLALIFTVNSVSLPAQSGSPTGSTSSFSIIVPVGKTYSASWNASATVSAWYELR